MIRRVVRTVVSWWSLAAFAIVMAWSAGEMRADVDLNLPCHCCAGWDNVFYGSGGGTWNDGCSGVPGMGGDGCSRYTTANGQFVFCPGSWTFNDFTSGYVLGPLDFCIQKAGYELAVNHGPYLCPGVSYPSDPGDHQECCCGYCQDWQPTLCPHGEDECTGSGCSGQCGFQWHDSTGPGQTGYWDEVYNDCPGGPCSCPPPTRCGAYAGEAVISNCGGTPHEGQTCDCADLGYVDVDQDGCCSNEDLDDEDPEVCLDPADPCADRGGDADEDGCCADVDIDDDDEERCSICAEYNTTDLDEDGCCDDIDANNENPQVCQGCSAKCRWERETVDDEWELTGAGCEETPEEEPEGEGEGEPEGEEEPPEEGGDDGEEQWGPYCDRPDSSGSELVKYTECKCRDDCNCGDFWSKYFNRWREKLEKWWPELGDLTEYDSSLVLRVPLPLWNNWDHAITIDPNPNAWPYVGASAGQIAWIVKGWTLLMCTFAIVRGLISDFQTF